MFRYDLWQRVKVRVFVLGVLAVIGCDAAEQINPSASTAQKTISVHLSIDFGQRAAGISSEQKIAADQTVFNLLEQCQQAGVLIFDASGSGETAFLHSINGIKNEPALTGNHWLFFVNDELADRGCGVAELNDGDRVLWKYTTDSPQ